MKEPAKTVYLIRHAQTAWHHHPRCAGQTDVELSDTGRAQAETLTTYFQDRPLATVVGSDLQRARHTAEPICRQKGLSYTADPRLREIHYGILEGTDTREWATEHPELMKRWNVRSFTSAPPEGESRKALLERASTALEAIVAQHPGPIAVFSHAGAIKALVAYVVFKGLGLEVDRTLPTFGFGNCSITTLRVQEGRWTIFRLNECPVPDFPSS